MLSILRRRMDDLRDLLHRVGGSSFAAAADIYNIRIGEHGSAPWDPIAPQPIVKEETLGQLHEVQVKGAAVWLSSPDAEAALAADDEEERRVAEAAEPYIARGQKHPGVICMPFHGLFHSLFNLTLSNGFA